VAGSLSNTPGLGGCHNHAGRRRAMAQLLGKGVDAMELDPSIRLTGFSHGAG
jgi:hypothetical protein